MPSANRRGLSDGKGLVKNGKRPRFPVEVADPNAVRNVLKNLLEGQTLGRACGNAKVTRLAFWRRVLDDAVLKREFAASLMDKAIDRTDQFSAGGNSTLVSTFAKVAKDAAASLSPSDWGDKVQVENRTLVIHTNLDFRVCETLEGIIQSTDEPLPDDRQTTESDLVSSVE